MNVFIHELRAPALLGQGKGRADGSFISLAEVSVKARQGLRGGMLPRTSAPPARQNVHPAWAGCVGHVARSRAVPKGAANTVALMQFPVEAEVANYVFAPMSPSRVACR